MSMDKRNLCMANNAESLWSICLDYCTEHPEHIFNKTEEGFVVRGDDSLPRVVCDALLKHSAERSQPEISDLLNAFVDVSRCDLKCLDLRCYDEVTDKLLEALLRHRPTEVYFSSDDVTIASIKNLNNFGSNIHTLLLGHSTGIFEPFSNKLYNFLPDEDDNCDDRLDLPVLNIPNLRVFGINSLPELESSAAAALLSRSLTKMPKLIRLDLSECPLLVCDLERSFKGFRCLVELNLSNVNLEPLSTTLPIISQVTSLRAVDLSQSLQDGRRNSYNGEVDSLMQVFISKLPSVVWLELAGTNLAGVPPVVSFSHRPGKSPPAQPPSIPWLQNDSRVFEYLGLLNCVDNACERDNLPARRISGDANEKQTLLAVQSYTNKRELLLLALNNLFHIIKVGECSDHKQALDGIVMAMKAHMCDKAVQISGSASLFYVVKGELRHHLSTSTKKQLLKIILNAMECHMEEATMLRNGCLTLCHFQLPQDVMHCYRRLVALLNKVAVIRLPDSETFVQRISIYLLNSLACQVDTREKLLIGELGAFKTMLQIIRERVASENCDEVMEVAWSMMWNVTDETAQNSERFIDEQGMETFLECLKAFPDKEELLRNMMGLMGNVAEVNYLRPRLMNQAYLTIFSDLLSSASDGIEVSYNACGVLANLMSDGAVAWTITTPSRDSVLQKMREAIGRWKLNSKRNINYRSFKPILRLLDIRDTPEVQHWAVWALCNLTRMYKSKYCPLLEQEGGLDKLHPLARDNQAYPEIRQLASQVIDRCHRFKSDPTTLSDDEEDTAED